MQTALKALQLIDLLSGIRSYTKEEIKERLLLSDRSFYRYMETLKDFGFVVDHADGRYRLEKNNKTVKDLSSLLHFSEEEAYLLNEAINHIETSTKTRENLVGKLSALYDTDRIAVRFVAKEQSSKIKPLLEGIRRKLKVRVTEYRSSVSGKITDRVIEPFAFTPNYIAVWAWEPESGMNKLFKVERMRRTELTGEKWTDEEKHHADPVDCFRVSGPARIPLSFEMTLLAKNLLTEEFPLSEKYITATGENNYRFDGWITAYEGAGRFILGLPGEIFNISNHGFRNFLEEKTKKWKEFFKNDK